VCKLCIVEFSLKSTTFVDVFEIFAGNIFIFHHARAHVFLTSGTPACAGGVSCCWSIYTDTHFTHFFAVWHYYRSGLALQRCTRTRMEFVPGASYFVFYMLLSPVVWCIWTGLTAVELASGFAVMAVLTVLPALTGLAVSAVGALFPTRCGHAE